MFYLAIEIPFAAIKRAFDTVSDAESRHDAECYGQKRPRHFKAHVRICISRVRTFWSAPRLITIGYQRTVPIVKPFGGRDRG